MHLGLIMECDYRESGSQEDAFQEAFKVVDEAENNGLDGVWLAERHFAAPKRPTDALGAGIPSIVSVPMILASSIAARTGRVRIGMAVAVLPLCHPIRMAEEAATVDQISRGRLEFGGAERVCQGLRGLRHPLRREPGTLPRVFGSDYESLDRAPFLPPREVFHLRRCMCGAEALSEALPPQSVWPPLPRKPSPKLANAVYPFS